MTETEYGDVETCVDAIFDRLGTDITVGAPLGLGKPNHVLNELVDRAVENPEIDLTIWSALTLSRPDWGSELERRLVEPLADRIFGSYPGLEYDRLLQAGELPDNVEVHQFFFRPGAFLDNPGAQQHHHSVNYTHVPRAIEAADVDLLVLLVGEGELDGTHCYNLGGNTDVAREVMEMVRSKRTAEGEDLMVVGQVNRNLPFMYGDAPIEGEHFDAILDDEDYQFQLAGPPNLPVSTQDHAIGLRVSALVRDGGTLQIGIGTLGEAIGSALALRHEHPDDYAEALDALGVTGDCRELIDEYGGIDPFEEGLYGGSEMFAEPLLHLYERGVLSREVYDDLHVQRLLEEGHLDDGIDAAALDALVEAGAISPHLDREDVRYLREWGILRSDVEFRDDALHVGDRWIPADLTDEAARSAIVEHALGDSLDGGVVLHAAFFLGSKGFYEGIRDLSPEQRRKIAMDSVGFTNQLYGNEKLKRLQRRDARFVNSGLKATVTGAVVSDALEDNRVLSGVGGQFNFVNMAHELEGGRSIVMIRATRESGGDVESNVVWNYGHVTVPRHLRDIVVTEYGVADLRDRSDAEVIAEMIKIADSRFQDELVEAAKEAGKLPADWEVPPGYRNNYPEALEESLAPHRDVLPTFPYGTELTREERDLARALRTLERRLDSWPPDLDLLEDLQRTFPVPELDSLEGLRRTLPLPDLHSLESLQRTLLVPDEAEPYLERMDLARPRTPREVLYKRLVVFALAESNVV